MIKYSILAFIDSLLEEDVATI